MTRLWNWIFYIGLILGTNAVAADSALTDFLKDLRTLQADFVQTVISGNHNSTSAGTLYLSRPGRFRWSYTKPMGQEVIADGKRIWMYDPELIQVSHQSQEDALRGTPALLLSDDRPIEEHFNVTALGTIKGLYWIELIPKSKDSEIVRVNVGFDQQRLDRFEMVDAFGQITRLTLYNMERNPGLSERLFRFTPPPEVDILQR